MKISTAATADVICILVFAVVGRSSHGEASTILGVAGTAWPFLVGSLVGVLLLGRHRNPVAIRTGVGVWICSVVGGMLLRLASGDTASPAFVVVATVALGVLLLGWRVAHTAVQGARRTSRPSSTASSHGRLPHRSHS